MDSLIQAVHDAWPETDSREIYDWARDYIDLPAGGYSIPGKFHVEKSRYAIKVFQDYKNDRIRKQSVRKGTQLFGTGIFDICAVWSVGYRPGPLMFNMQTDPIAKSHSTTRLGPLFKQCSDPRIRSLLPDNPDHDAIQEKIFRNGNPLYIQGPSIGNLQSKSISKSFNDEIWIWKPGRLGEAHARVDAYKRVGASKVANISQGGYVKDDMEAEMHEGDMAEWEVACLNCGQFFLPTWSAKTEDGFTWGIVWDGGSNPIWETVRWVCPHCRKGFPDGAETKARLNETGRYRITNPHASASVKSYHWNALIATPLPELVGWFLKATAAKNNGVIELLKAFIQKALAEPFHDDLIVERMDIRTQAYKPDGAWSEEFIRFMTVDKQMGHFWYVIRAWSKFSDSRLLYFGRAVTWEELREAQIKFGVRDACVFVDCRHDTHEVYGQTAVYDWNCMRGEDREDFVHKEDGLRRLYAPEQQVSPVVGKKSQELAAYLTSLTAEAMQRYTEGRLAARIFMFAKPALQGILTRFVKGLGPSWEVYELDRDGNALNPQYPPQINSVDLRTKHNEKTGREESYWHERRNDHARDCELMQLAAAAMAEILVNIDFNPKAKEAA